ncbi:MAG: hypothetical protein ABIN58_00850 [candidate division WOR-3 bacterium]
MARPELSGKMVRLNGTNQNLYAYYPGPLSWNAMFLRMSLNQARYPGATEYAMDFVTYGGCLLRILSLSERWFRWVVSTTGGYKEIDETITSGTTDEWGALHFALAWDGTDVALYIGNR